MQDGELISDAVQQCITQLLNDLKLKNHNLKVSKGTAPGDNFLGVILKVEATGQGANGNVKTLHLMVKTAPRNEVFRKHTSIPKLFQREISVYTEVIPVFIKFQEERNVLSTFNSFANCYKTIKDEMDETIIMENMQTLGYVTPDRTSTLDYNHVLLVMKEYGRLHALSFAIRDQNPELFEKLTANMKDDDIKYPPSQIELELRKKGMRETVERALGAFDPVADKEEYERFKTYHERALFLFYNAVSSKSAGEYAVFGHGDCWLNNILFKYEDPEASNIPTVLCFIDWQLARLASPALDISYFLFTCVSEETRAEHYEHFIQEYYNSLCTFLRELGSNPEELFPFKILEEQLKKFSVYGLHMAMIVLYLIVSNPDEIPDLQNSASDEETMKKFQYQTKNMEKYYERFRSVVKHLIKYNYEF